MDSISRKMTLPQEKQYKIATVDRTTTMDAWLESQREANSPHPQRFYLNVESRGVSMNQKSYW